MSYQVEHNRVGTPVRRFARFVREVVAGLDALHRAQFETPWAKAEGRKAGR